jgi:hypothetical protein
MTSNKDMPIVPMVVDTHQCDAEESGGRYITSNGLTKLEHFAGLAMQGLLANPVMGDSDLHSNHREWVEDMTSASIEFAKALLSQLEDKGDE